MKFGKFETDYVITVAMAYYQTLNMVHHTSLMIIDGGPRLHISNNVCSSIKPGSQSVLSVSPRSAC